MKIVLGVCGSIAAYKTYDLLRSLIKNGHQVRVVLTQKAQSLVHAQMFRYLGADDVWCDQREWQGNEHEIGHIQLARWADQLVLCPLTANTMGLMAHGLSPNLLTSLFLAFERYKPILAFKAMNTQMLTNPLVQENEEKLTSLLPNLFIHPSSFGKLACQEQGQGKLPTIEEIVALIESTSLTRKNKRILITTGATIAPLDPVRYLTNPSSGMTGFYLAKDYLKMGFQVTVIAGKNATTELNNLINHPHFKLTRVVSTEDMYQEVLQEFPHCDIYLSPAAISDISFKSSTQKMKKNQIKSSLAIEAAPDILASVLKLKHHQIIIGFAAETDLTEEQLMTKWRNKPCDLLVGTRVDNGLIKENENETQGFGTDQANYLFLNKKGEYKSMALNKGELAGVIASEVQL